MGPDLAVAGIPQGMGLSPSSRSSFPSSSCEAANQPLSYRQKLFLSSAGSPGPMAPQSEPSVAVFQCSDNLRASTDSHVRAQCQGPEFGLFSLFLLMVKNHQPALSSPNPCSFEHLHWPGSPSQCPGHPGDKVSLPPSHHIPVPGAVVPLSALGFVMNSST